MSVHGQLGEVRSAISHTGRKLNPRWEGGSQDLAERGGAGVSSDDFWLGGRIMRGAVVYSNGVVTVLLKGYFISKISLYAVALQPTFIIYGYPPV